MLTQFEGNLSCIVEAGQIFVIRARPIDDAERIDINFLTGKTDEADNVLHLSVRFDEDVVVRNSRISGKWGAEERGENLNELTAPNPITIGEIFKLYILVGDDRFNVALNEHPYCIYRFRMSISDIRTITITRDVQQIVQVDHRQVFPAPFPAIQFDDPVHAFSNDVPKHFFPGHVIIITAIPFGNPRGGFIIKFTENGTKRQALHFNPRFDPLYVVVRNSQTESLEFRREEERSGGFPFVLDQQFKLAIGLTESEFKFSVNGSVFGAYAYRNVNQLNILNGFKVQCTNGMQLEVTNVDHINIGVPDCEGFESYSHPEVIIS
ncbi:32 kDa beta-galactoside-binding lectin lec-3 [Toxorhynchites rutilus septentrionalis]|uniref:32 kDa beta-galactoside-binding lectin lec-3 n=1 Tax=Toxorhynchites rutilus septentrionalis TaxID=329112 RepID=UPI0024783D80|nr:32 kDa beta-galactoside-binding lectin lec-3 [Toxorhynchites rutilus septentrionalis]